MEVYHAVFISAECLPWLVSSASPGFSSPLSPSPSPTPSSSTQHARRKHWLRAFSDYQTQGFSSPSSASSSSSTQHARIRKHLPRAFSDYQAQGFSSSSTQHSRRMDLLRAFSDHHTRLDSAEQQQQSPALSVRTGASVGRFSGAVHGSNSRKGRRRKRSDTVQQENNQELDGKEKGDEPISEERDGHMFSDDVPYDRDSDRYIHYDDAPCLDEDSSLDCTGSPPSSSHMYDSIHGDFWRNDPYYQEFETLETETAKQNQVRDGPTRGFVQAADRSNDTSVACERSFMERDGSLRNSKCLLAAQGGNGAAIAHEYVDISESKSVLPPTATEGHDSASPPFQEMVKSSKESFPSNTAKQSRVQDLVSVLERDQQCNLDPQQGDVAKDMVREVASAEAPSASLGSLLSVEVEHLESRQFSGNGETAGTDFKCTEAILTGVDGSYADLTSSNTGAFIDIANMAEESGNPVTEVTIISDASALPVVEQVGQVVEQVAELSTDSFMDQVERLPGQVSQAAEEVMQNVVDQVAEALPDSVVEQVGQVAEQVTQTADYFVEQVTSHVVEPFSTTASQIADFLSSDEDHEESDDEFEAYASLDIPEFKGRQGLSNFTVLQEQQGIISVIYDFYIFMLKRSLFEFMLGMFAAPVLLSVIFTILYLPEFNGLALDETVRDFLQSSDLKTKGGLAGLQLSWDTVFQVFMFSVSLSTGLQPELSPLSPYTLVVANLNALFAQLIFVFLSGAVFARLSQPSQPVKCSTVAIVCPPPSNRRLRKEACHKALLTRYVLVGPQPCELVDVKVDLTYNYNTVTRSGTYFRTSQSLKLVRPEIAFLNHGMLVRHIIDETSPLYQRTQGMLEKEDAVFSLSVVGLERSSMQSVFHVQHYCVYDKDVVWDAEFVDMILINKKNRRVVDHSFLSQWRTIIPR